MSTVAQDYGDSGIKTCGAIQNPEFPQTGLDQNRPGVGEHFKNIFRSGRRILFWVGQGRDIFNRGVLLSDGGTRHLFPGYRFWEKHVFHSQLSK